MPRISKRKLRGKAFFDSRKKKVSDNVVSQKKRNISSQEFADHETEPSRKKLCRQHRSTEIDVSETR